MLVLTYAFILAFAGVNIWMVAIFGLLPDGFAIEVSIRIFILVMSIFLYLWKSTAKRYSMYKRISLKTSLMLIFNPCRRQKMVDDYSVERRVTMMIEEDSKQALSV